MLSCFHASLVDSTNQFTTADDVDHATVFRDGKSMELGGAEHLSDFMDGCIIVLPESGIS